MATCSRRRETFELGDVILWMFPLIDPPKTHHKVFQGLASRAFKGVLFWTVWEFLEYSNRQKDWIKFGLLIYSIVLMASCLELFVFVSIWEQRCIYPFWRKFWRTSWTLLVVEDRTRLTIVFLVKNSPKCAGGLSLTQRKHRPKPLCSWCLRLSGQSFLRRTFLRCCNATPSGGYVCRLVRPKVAERAFVELAREVSLFFGSNIDPLQLFSPSTRTTYSNHLTIRNL